MKKILMLSTAYTSMDLIRNARANQIYTIVTDYLEPEVSWAKQIADEVWDISTADLDTLAQKCREEHVDGIVCGISPFNINMTIALCEKVGLPCWWNQESWHYSMNKRDFKDLCMKAGVPVARDYRLSLEPTEEELAEIEYPVVVKAIDLNGNRGMSYAYNRQDLLTACDYARSLSASDVVIVERMLKGREYTGQYVMANGEASLLNFNAMFSQPGFPENCYSITTTNVNPKHLKRYLDEVDPYFKQALKIAGCHDGVCNIEVFLDEDDHFYALEMGYRLSGDMFAHPMKGITGFDSYKWLLEIATGVKHSPSELPVSQTKLADKIGCSYILWSLKEGLIGESSGVEEIAALPNVTVENFRPDNVVHNHSYITVFTFVTDTQQEMDAMISKINETVKYIDTEGENLVIYFDDFESLHRECGML